MDSGKVKRDLVDEDDGASYILVTTRDRQSHGGEARLLSRASMACEFTND
jgi:hypothetical protein